LNRVALPSLGAAETAGDFVERMNRQFADLALERNAAGWTQSAFITSDTQLLNAHADCSIYGNDAAGRTFGAMLAGRSSPPWQDRFHEVTGTWQVDASATMGYSAPLRGWLAEQNNRQQCGW
jgi:hypothetical protein